MSTKSQSSRYQVTHGSSHDLPDVSDFLELLEHIDTHPVREVRELFDNSAELFVTRAPGRLDLMGGIADYSGSLVLQLPVSEATLAALQRDPQRRLTIVSLAEDSSREIAFKMSLDEFERNAELISYAEARKLFHSNPGTHWSSYVAGVLLVLMRERGIRFTEGARILLSSNVPEGKGVSSSAAIEVASMAALVAAFNLEISTRDIALLCQKVENEVVGAPCGVMDQMTAAAGRADELLTLLCQPAELHGTIALPPDLAVWGIDSGMRHYVGGDDYGSVRTGAFMGYRIIADIAGLQVQRGEKSLSIDDERWGGFLANVTPSEFETSFAQRLPERLTGGEFIERYDGITDTVTTIQPDRVYAVLKPTAHPIYEHFRVRTFAELLTSRSSGRRNETLGELMYQSHASYSACGLGSAGTDLLVNLVRELGPSNGLFGAKITGGGSGGTVAVLGARSAETAVRQVVEKYHEAMNLRPYVFAGSSSGSAKFGYLKLERKPLQ
jgi:galactokinase